MIKMMKSKKIIALLTVSILCILTFSCSDSPKPETNNSENNLPGNDENAVETVQEIKEDILSKLPQKDYEGKEIRILNTSGGPWSQYWLHLDIIAEQETGEPLNDTIYARNKKVEEHFNVKIREIEGLSAGEVRNTMQRSVKAGSDDFEIFLTDTNEASTIAAQGLNVDFSTLPVVDLNAPYWDKDMKRDLSINNKTYFLAGDFLLTHYDATHVLMVNKKLLKNLQLEDPYELIKSNNWTFNKFYEMCKSVGRDLDGNGVMDYNDMFGYSSWHHMTLPSFMLASGQWSILKDSTDKPVINLNNEIYIEIFHKYMDMMTDSMMFYDGNKKQPRDDFISEKMFRNEQILFFTEIAYYAIELRDLDIDFGFLPHPKYDAKSDVSKSYVISPNVINIPITNSNLECTAVVLEALNSISRDTVIPAYYEITLKLKASRDEQSSEVLDLIFNNRSYDMGFGMYGNVVGGRLIGMAEKSDSNITSFYESNAPRIETELQKTIDFYFN